MLWTWRFSNLSSGSSGSVCGNRLLSDELSNLANGNGLTLGETKSVMAKREIQQHANNVPDL